MKYLVVNDLFSPLPRASKRSDSPFLTEIGGWTVRSFLISLVLVLPTPVLAQLIPDTTLGIESSSSTPIVVNGLPVDRIDGGANRLVNLFHSFQDFNVQAGRGVYFTNPIGVQNIVTRVTGTNPSNILGTLGVLGNANLFLINPRGIIFGPAARLDVRGAFFASTADSLVFNDGFEFGATNPQTPLLTINIPIGLRFRDNPGPITNQSVAIQGFPGVSPFPTGLAVDPGQTLALIGGDVQLPSGNVTALQGTILLGSVVSPGFVGFVPTTTGLSLDYGGIARFGTITASGTASMLASGVGGGAIQVQGSNVSLSDRAALISDTVGNVNGQPIQINASQFNIGGKAFVSAITLGTGSSGNITVQATDAVTFTGAGFANYRQFAQLDPANGISSIADRQSGLIVGTGGPGRSGNITVDTPRLTLQEGTLISGLSDGAGSGGSVTLRAPESITIDASGVFGTAFSSGNAGMVTVETGRLTIRNGAALATSSSGTGNSNNLSIQATDIVLSSSRADSLYATGIATTSIGHGNAGNLDINTRSLLIEGGSGISSSSGITTINGIFFATGRGGNVTINATDSVTLTNEGLPMSDTPNTFRSQIASGTLSSGAGGDVKINTQRLTLRGGGGIIASTLGSGNGGNINVWASESVEISGGRDAQTPSGIFTTSGDSLLQPLFQLPPPSGAAGNLSLITPQLGIQDGGLISVGSLGMGRAGSLHVSADSIALDNHSSIFANTLSGTGGNINLQAQTIQLRRGSRISTDAGSSAGGNITINARFLIAFPDGNSPGNSDITANAQTAQGGRVTLNVHNLFGITALTRDQARQRLGLSDAEFAALTVNPTTLLPSNDIAAISQATGPNLAGTVTFSTIGTDPAQGLVELPQTMVDPNALITANPCTQSSRSEFVITGRGGLPPNPGDVLTSQPTDYNWIAPVRPRDAGTAPIAQTASPDRPTLQPAQGWVMNSQGKVVLIATNPTPSDTQRNWRSSGTCLPR